MNRLIQFEVRKIFSKRLTQSALIILLLSSLFLNYSTYQNMYAFDGVSAEGTGKTAVAIEQAIAEKYEGILTEEKMRQMMADFAPKSDLHGMSAVYLYYNSVQSATFSRFSDPNGNWNGVSVSDAFGDEKIKIGFTKGWLSTSQNMVRVFIILSLVIAIMIAPVFSGEYGGVDSIILTSKYGKTKCAKAKVIASFLSALLVTAVISAVNYIFAGVLYGKSGLNCSVLFAPIEFCDGYIPFNITCGTLLKYQMLLALTNAASIVGSTLILSAICRNQVATLVASVAIHFFPIILPVSETSPLFRYMVLLPLYHVQFVSIMSVEQMNSGVLYAVWAIPVALVFMGCGIFISHRIFAKHQVM